MGVDLQGFSGKHVFGSLVSEAKANTANVVFVKNIFTVFCEYWQWIWKRKQYTVCLVNYVLFLFCKYENLKLCGQSHTTNLLLSVNKEQIVGKNSEVKNILSSFAVCKNRMPMKLSVDTLITLWVTVSVLAL